MLSVESDQHAHKGRPTSIYLYNLTYSVFGNGGFLMPIMEGAVGSVLVDTKGAAHYLNITVRNLENLRLTGNGPQFVRLSRRCVRYRLTDLDHWVAGRLKSSTSEP